MAAALGAAYYFLLYAHRVPPEVAYVLPLSATVVDTPAALRSEVAKVKNGERVEVLHRTHNWARIALADGRTGWIELKDLLDSETYEEGQKQIRQFEKIPAQAAGHTTGQVRAHLEPSRESPQLALLGANKHVEIFDRRWLERASQDSDSPATADRNEDAGASSSPAVSDAWYLIRAGSLGGWVLGRFITLDVPPDLAPFAQGVNTVAWFVLTHVKDNGRDVPEYLVADRIGTQECDFNHIRVFTWWSKNQHYVTAYVESKLKGYFPVRIKSVGDTPEFRLRLLDRNGHKIQKVYGMFSTIVRPLGFVDGWESDAAPTRIASSSKRRHRR